jgi:hypothetical protein
LLARAVIRIDEWAEPAELLQAEEEIKKQHCRAYLYTREAATESARIHQLEEMGYRFSEFRIRSMIKFDGAAESTRSLYPWKSELIGDESTFAAALELLRTSPCDDRFSRDVALPAGFSEKRNRTHLEKSFRNWPDEFLLGVVHAQTGELIAFRSGAFLSKSEAHYYQYAISPTRDYQHTAAMLDAFTLEFLHNKGIQLIHAVSTGFNISELNRLILQSGFTIQASDVILRKTL